MKRKRKNKVGKKKIIDGIIKRKSNGYIQIFCGMRWVSEHRLVVENFIGRELKENEVIHHIDFNKENNSINNLMIFKSQREHAEFHIYFAKYGFNQRVRRMIAERWKDYMRPQLNDTKDL